MTGSAGIAAALVTWMLPVAMGAQSPSTVPRALESRVETIVESTLSRNGVAGAVVAIVRGDSVVHLRGYGIANRDEARPVDPERTTFGLSSVSKVFTAIAVLRLVEQGRLSLDDVVYGRVPLAALADERGRRVRVSHLLTHSAGFDERTIGIAARTPGDVVPLGDYLAAEMPPVVREPGITASYSNHGFALAGLVVERAAGEPFADYVRRHVLDPLGMRSSSFDQPLPAELEESRAVPYRRDPASPVPRIYFNDPPASALYSTGADMARFMAAFLGDSTLALGGVLRSSRPMRERQFTHHPALNGLTYGFRERSDGGVRGLQQGGDWDDYTSDLMLAPAARLGVFVALSGDGASRIADSVWRHLIARDGDVADGAGSGNGVAVGDVASVGVRADPAGRYRLNRYSRRTLARMGVLTGAIREVAVTRRGSRLSMGGQALDALGPDLYQRLEGGRVAFRVDANGHATHLFTDGIPYAAYERVHWSQRRELHLASLGIAFLILLGTLWRAAVSWPLAPVRDDRVLAGWRWGMTAAAGGATWLVVGLVAALLVIPLGDFQYGAPRAVQIVLVGGLVAIGGAIVALVMAAAINMRPVASRRSRVGRLALSLVAVLFAVLVYYWRLLPMYT